ncbi:hypothetical protein SKAU_G00095960 [Synaphobranchus kaupii]|uniref:Uncharacterized protein n=1 Tax=Synaphobranchus kaupii TaxID=118154 RepID=A0A9Q1FYG5_SYNKA|nr:hypothetical protein SKAU_G00095960 [Synaphobranchus kaupii]
MLLLLLVTTPGFGLQTPKIIQAGPKAGILLRDDSGFLVADAQTITYQIYVSLDPLQVIQRYKKEPQHVYREETRTWYQDHLAHTRTAVKTTLRQLEWTAVYIDTPDRALRPKRAVFGVLLALSTIGSLFSSSMSIANTVSYNTLKKSLDSLQRDLEHIREQIQQQKSALEDMRTTLEDTVLLVNLHSRLINSTITQVQILTNSLNEERTFPEPVRLLTNDLLREIGLGINDLIQGRIPTYLVNETVISGILQKVSPDTVIDFLQVRIAYNMGAAVPLFVDVENMQVALIVSLPFIRPENIYQLKAIINVGAWNGSYLTTVITPPVVAYQEKFTQYLVPNLKLCKKAKDLHWLCPMPENSVIHVGDTALYHLDHGTYQAEVETIDVFRGQELEITEELEELLAKKDIHTLQVTVKRQGITYDLPRRDGAENHMAGNSHAILSSASMALLALILVLLHALWLHRKIHALSLQVNQLPPRVVYQANAPDPVPSRVSFQP